MTLPLRIELAMTFKAVFPDILARDRSGHGRPEASEAVSGCNILILPRDASILRAQRRAREMPKNCIGASIDVGRPLVHGDMFGPARIVFSRVQAQYWASNRNTT